LFGTAIALVVFPTMAEQFNAGDIQGLRDTASRSLRIIWFLTFPAAAGLVLLGRPVINLLLQGGAFTAESAQIVYGVLVVFSIRVVSESTVEIAARLFYAQHNTRTPMFAYITWLILDIALAYLLIEQLGIVALALASTVAFTYLAAILLIKNNRIFGDLLDKDLALSAGRAIVATAGMSIVIFGLSSFISQPLLLLVVGGLCGMVTYLLLTIILGGEEIPQLIRLIRSR
jgi:putative peptidoglycan lipid II flippase